MAKEELVNNRLTRGDKTHKKFMEKYNVYKDGLVHGLDSITELHKQTIDSRGEFYEKVTNSQEVEKIQLYEIIKSSDDETKIKQAYARLSELDCIKDKTMKEHTEFLQDEGEKANKNIVGNMLCLAAAGGLLIGSNKQLRQKLLSIGNSIIKK